MIRQAIKKARGFTLIELMITVAIVAIMAAIAYPSYKSSIQKSRRTEAKTTLEDLAAQQERYYYQNNAYNRALTNLSYSQDNWNNSENGYYRFQVVRTGCHNTTDLCPSYILEVQSLSTSTQYSDPWWYRLSSDGTKQRQNCPSGTCSGGWVAGWNE